MAFFPLNVGKTENNGIANSQMWQMGNWVRETLSIRLKALLQLRSCPLSVILGGAALQEAQRKLLIWSRSTIRAGCYLDDLVPAKPAVWSLSKQHRCVLILAQSLQDWERRWGQLHKSLVKINTFICKRCLRDLSPKSSFMQQFLHCSGSIFGRKGHQALQFGRALMQW